MSDLISRQAALDAIQQRADRIDSIYSAFWEGLIIAQDIVKNIPSAEPERTAKVEEDEWIEHKMLSRDYGKIYYQHDCCCDLYESPYQFCPYCGKKMKRKKHD